MRLARQLASNSVALVEGARACEGVTQGEEAEHEDAAQADSLVLGKLDCLIAQLISVLDRTRLYVFLRLGRIVDADSSQHAAAFCHSFLLM